MATLNMLAQTFETEMTKGRTIEIRVPWIDKFEPILLLESLPDGWARFRFKGQDIVHYVIVDQILGIRVRRPGGEGSED